MGDDRKSKGTPRVQPKDRGGEMSILTHILWIIATYFAYALAIIEVIHYV